MTPLTDKLMYFRKSLIGHSSYRSALPQLMEDLDDIITEVSGEKFRSCPICHDILTNRNDGSWLCESVGNHGGNRLVFLEGKRPCEHIHFGGPYCTLNGFCLWQVHGPLGHPVRCRMGRIDAQSPTTI